MNARSHIFHMVVDDMQMSEAILSLFHSLLFHRTVGKFQYKQCGSYSIGTLGMIDVDCDFIDFTYVRVSSEELEKRLRQEINFFVEEMRRNKYVHGDICLQFYQMKKNPLFGKEEITWEVWTIKLEVKHGLLENERQLFHEKVGEDLLEKILYITEAMGKHEYVPSAPNQSEIDLIYDTTFTDVQPFLFKITSKTNPDLSPSVSTSISKFIKNTLAF